MSVKITLENEHYDSVCVPKTIEERALASWNERYPEGSERYRDAQIDGYIAGATEQQAIDKRLILDAYCKRCLDMCGGYPCLHKCYEYIEYAKTLEE